MTDFVGKIASGAFAAMRAVCFIHVQLFASVWTVARQALLSLGFPRQEYCSGLPFPPPRDLPDPVIEPMSSALGGRFFTSELPGKPDIC